MKKKQNKFKCWWCKEEANSGEHKFKRTDLIEEFGDSFNDELDRAVLVNDYGEFYLQSPKSKFVKFEKVLCAKCNNDKSQDFDKSYSTFMKYILSNYKKYEPFNSVDLRDIYGKEWFVNKINLFSYFVKHFCCRLARNNVKIKTEVIDFLEKRVSYLEIINFSIQQKADLNLFLKLMKNEGYKDGFLQFGKLMYFPDEKGEIDMAHTYLTRRWLRVEMYYSNKITAINFPSLKEFFSNPFINMPALSLINLNNITTRQEFVEEFQKFKVEKTGPEKIKEINDYFQANPYEIK